MKNKLFLSLLLGLLGVLSISANAELIASNNYTKPGCSWNFISSNNNPYQPVHTYRLMCSGVSGAIASRNQGVPTYYVPNPACTIVSPAAGYTLTGSTCSNYSINTATAPTPTACQLSGKAGDYVTSASSSGVVGAAQTTSAYCSPCGYYSTHVGNGVYAFYCNNQ